MPDQTQVQKNTDSIAALTAAVSQLTQNAASSSERMDQLMQNMASRSERIDERIDQLTQNAASSSERINQLANTIDVLVDRFIRPATQQANANREAIAALIERGQLYQDWLDEDRHDINELRQETAGQIQALIAQANADRRATNELRQETASQIQALIDQANADRQASLQRFEAMQAEIRQNQRLLLSGQEKNETLLTEVLNLSRRLDAVEDAA